jgi:hypothetical protein
MSTDDDECEEVTTWSEWFTRLPGNDFLVDVDPTFLEDIFNLYGMRSIIGPFREVHELVMGDAPDSDKDGTSHELFEDAKNFYALVHARFIVTVRGLTLMVSPRLGERPRGLRRPRGARGARRPRWRDGALAHAIGPVHSPLAPTPQLVPVPASSFDPQLDKYETKDFGQCPRKFCNGTAVLPMGLSDDLGEGCVQLFCPRCEEIYDVPKGAFHEDVAKLDGAFFGPTFPHMVLLTKPQLAPSKESSDTYIPRVFGFRIQGMPGRKALADSMHVGGAIAERKAQEAAAASGDAVMSSSSSSSSSAAASSSNSAAATGGVADGAGAVPEDSGGRRGSERLNGIGADGRVTLRSTPLTSRWDIFDVRPPHDDFHDDEEDAAEAAASRSKRRKEAFS